MRVVREIVSRPGVTSLQSIDTQPCRLLHDRVWYERPPRHFLFLPRNHIPVVIHGVGKHGHHATIITRADRAPKEHLRQWVCFIVRTVRCSQHTQQSQFFRQLPSCRYFGGFTGSAHTSDEHVVEGGKDAFVIGATMHVHARYTTTITITISSFVILVGIVEYHDPDATVQEIESMDQLARHHRQRCSATVHHFHQFRCTRILRTHWSIHVPWILHVAHTNFLGANPHGTQICGGGRGG
mmetsp:Transcript_5363/g.6553  ORF Transcript_5363/g.6553 Transcript_5363/m.6553 type:complete len:239 (-) Transcript_5363:578-1294(-)